MGVRRLLVLSGVLGLLLLLGASPASAGTDPSERIRELNVALALRTDGSMHVTETIVYDFGTTTDRHGIVRSIPVVFDYDADRNRVYPLTGASASSPTGAPAAVDVTGGDLTTLQVGDKDTEVRGAHTYVVQYDLAGVVNTVGGGQELYWNVLGLESEVAVEKASVTVTGPGSAVQRAACFEGAARSDEACPWSVIGGTASYTAARALAPHEGLTVVAGFPAGTFPGAVPILREKWKFTKAFALDVGTGAGALGVLALVGGGTAVLAAVRGRDRRYMGLTPGLTPGGGQEARTGRVELRRPPVAVRFTPPEGLRVGELGTLIDERANVVDVTATIIDLAVRGYLRIEEVRPGEDWTLVRVDRPTGDLRGYEVQLYDAIFDGRERISLSELRETFSADLARTRALLYAEVVERGWFAADPRRVRARWYGYGSALLAVGVVGTVALAVWTHWAVVGVAAVVSGLVVLALAGRMPARTAAGTAVLTQVQGFRLYLETPRPTRSGSRRNGTSSAGTSRTRSCSAWPSGGPRCSPGSWRPVGRCPSPPGTSAQTGPGGRAASTTTGSAARWAPSPTGRRPRSPRRRPPRRPPRGRAGSAAGSPAAAGEAAASARGEGGAGGQCRRAVPVVSRPGWEQRPAGRRWPDKTARAALVSR